MSLDLIKKSFLLVLLTWQLACVSREKPSASEDKDKVIQLSKDLVCKSIQKLIAKDSQCAKLNEETIGGVSLSVEDFNSICSTARNYKALGLGAVNGKSFQDWYINKISSVFDYSADKMARMQNLIRQYNDGYGIGVGVHGSAAASAGAMAELVTHKNKVALFCAAAAGVATDVGVGADLTAIKTLGCQQNSDYTGQFASVALGGSFELVGLPVEVGGGFNLGINISKIIESFLPYWKSNRTVIKSEIARVHSLKIEDDSVRLVRDLTLVVFHSIDSAISNDANFSKNIEFTLKGSQNAASRYRKLLAKENPDFRFSKSIESLELILRNDSQFVHLTKVVNLFKNSLSGCNSVSFNFGVGVSLLPVSMSVHLSQYEMLSQVTVPTFANLNSFITDISAYLKSSDKSQCELNEEQKKAYIQVLYLLKTMDEARSLLPGFKNYATCAKKLSESAQSFGVFLSQQIQ